MKTNQKEGGVFINEIFYKNTIIITYCQKYLIQIHA